MKWMFGATGGYRVVYVLLTRGFQINIVCAFSVEIAIVMLKDIYVYHMIVSLLLVVICLSIYDKQWETSKGDWSRDWFMVLMTRKLRTYECHWLSTPPPPENEVSFIHSANVPSRFNYTYKNKKIYYTTTKLLWLILPDIRFSDSQCPGAVKTPTLVINDLMT